MSIETGVNVPFAAIWYLSCSVAVKTPEEFYIRAIKLTIAVY